MVLRMKKNRFILDDCTSNIKYSNFHHNKTQSFTLNTIYFPYNLLFLFSFQLLRYFFFLSFLFCGWIQIITQGGVCALLVSINKTKGLKRKEKHTEQQHSTKIGSNYCNRSFWKRKNEKKEKKTSEKPKNFHLFVSFPMEVVEMCCGV